MTDEPKAGDWVIWRAFRSEAKQIVAVTPMLLKLGNGWPRQLNRSDSTILGFAPDKETAERLKQSIDGIDGEYRRREQAAEEEYRRREKAARESRDAAVARLFGSEGAKP